MIIALTYGSAHTKYSIVKLSRVCTCEINSLKIMDRDVQQVVEGHTGREDAEKQT